MNKTIKDIIFSLLLELALFGFMLIQLFQFIFKTIVFLLPIRNEKPFIKKGFYLFNFMIGVSLITSGVIMYAESNSIFFQLFTLSLIFFFISITPLFRIFFMLFSFLPFILFSNKN